MADMIVANGDTLAITRKNSYYHEIELSNGYCIKLECKVITILTEGAEESYLPTINPIKLFIIWVGRLWRRRRIWQRYLTE